MLGNHHICQQLIVVIRYVIIGLDGSYFRGEIVIDCIKGKVYMISYVVKGFNTITTTIFPKRRNGKSHVQFGTRLLLYRGLLCQVIYLLYQEDH